MKKVPLKCVFLSSSLPKPILKKSVAPRPSSSRSTDDDIQGSKDALIQDLEKKLRSKEARRRSSQVSGRCKLLSALRYKRDAEC